MNIEERKILDNILGLSKNLPNEDIERFYIVMDNYLKNRSLLETIYYNLTTLKSCMQEEGLSEKEIVYAIMNNPSFIHAEKADLSLTFGIISVIQDSKTGAYLKNDIIINYGKMLRWGTALLYARVKHIMYLIDSKSPILRNNFITIRKVLKSTNQEFENSYKICKEDLLSKYPFKRESIDEINSWNEKYMQIKERQDNENKRTK